MVDTLQRTIAITQRTCAVPGQAAKLMLVFVYISALWSHVLS